MTTINNYECVDNQLVQVDENHQSVMVVATGTMQVIYTTESGVSVVAAWTRDVGTMERKLVLVLVYPNGERTPAREYAPSKLTVKNLRELMDLDGVEPEDIDKLYESIKEKKAELPVQFAGSGKCSLHQAYRALCDYVQTYEQPGVVFVTEGYGNIRASDLQKVLDKLNVGYSRLEIQKNFKMWGLLRTSEAADHVYAYRINRPGMRDWYFSFRLPAQVEAVQDEATKEVV